MEVFHRRQISSCTKVKLKGKRRWPISFREVLLDQAWSSILTSRLFHRLELEFRGPIRTHIAVIVQTTRNSSKGDVCSSNTEWRKRCKTRGAYSNRSRLHKGQVSDPLNWVLVARNNLVTAGMQEPFNQTGSPCTSDRSPNPSAQCNILCHTWNTGQFWTARAGETSRTDAPCNRCTLHWCTL